MRNVPFLVIAMTLLLSSCFFGGGNDQPEQEVKKEENGGITIGDGETEISIDSDELEDAMNQIKDAFSTKDEDGKAVEVVDFRELKEVMPKRMVGMKQTSSSGEKTGMLGFKLSTAEAEYEDGDQSMDVSVTDVAGIGLLTASMASWIHMDMDKETDTGFERTTEINGYPAFEKYDNKRKDGQISLIVAERFIVNIEGRNVSEKDMRRAVDALDIKSLARK